MAHRRVAQIPRRKRMPTDPAHQLALCKSAAAKDGIKHVERIQAAGKVLCRGHKRPVFLINNCFVIAPGHNTARELALRDIGGRPCRCLEAREELKLCRLSKLPITFSAFVIAARHKRRKRELLNRLHAERTTVETVKPGRFGNAQRMLRLLIRLKSRYHSLTDPRCKIHVRRVLGYSRIYGGIKYRYDPETPWVEATIGINMTWYNVLVKEKLAIVDGYLVTNVLEFNESNKPIVALEDRARELIAKFRSGESFGGLDVNVVDEYDEAGSRRFPFDRYKKKHRSKKTTHLGIKQATIHRIKGKLTVLLKH